MIASLRGILTSKKPEGITIDVNGVGYQVSVPLSMLSSLPDINKEVFVYVHTHVKEDAIALYGFSTEEQRHLFLSLIAISGIGPKLALSLLSSLSPQSFYEAIQRQDIGLLSKVPGLGKKTAQRIILELKSKLPALVPADTPQDSLYEDTLSALINLGYKRAVAQSALDKAYKSGIRDLEGLLKETFKYLSNEL